MKVKSYILKISSDGGSFITYPETRKEAMRTVKEHLQYKNKIELTEETYKTKKLIFKGKGYK
jgi:hypothetical protein